MSRHSLFSCNALVLAVLVSGCYSGPSHSVQRVDADEQIDLSGNWNDTDANQVAQVMIKDCLSRPWSSRYKQEKGKDPVVKLARIRNRSSEHINTKFFTKQVEMELVNSGIVKVVAAYDETEAARMEKDDQAVHASDETKKEQQQETGADFLLNGWIVTQNDRQGGQSVRAYVVTMELINVETQQKVWVKVHRIKKVVNQAEAEW